MMGEGTVNAHPNNKSNAFKCTLAKEEKKDKTQLEDPDNAESFALLWLSHTTVVQRADSSESGLMSESTFLTVTKMP